MENKTQRRFTVLDVALILLALLSIIGVWQRHNLKKLFAGQEILESYTLTFEVKCLRSTTVELLDKDVAFYTVHDGENISLGALQAQVSAAPATVYLPNPDPQLGSVEAVYPLDEYEYLLDVEGHLSCLGIERNGSFYVDGRLLLSRGQELHVRTETADLVIRVIDYKSA